MTERYSREMPERPTPLDLASFLPYACSQLQAPFNVRVVSELRDDYVSKTTEEKSKKGKSAKSTIQPTSRTFDSTQKRNESISVVAPAFDEESDAVIVLVTVYDTAGQLVELAFYHAPELPRMLFKLLALCVPFHPALGRLTVRWGPLVGDSLYEIAKFLPVSHLTEICLDDSPVPECNYYLLLERHSRLRSLSLARCMLDDRDCAALAARLHHPLPAARSLLMLALVANRISDAGASALAAALRSNRTLQYLNLCGNRITDVGAGRLLATLTEFPLTVDELVIKRRRLLDYLKLKNEVTKKCYAELAAAEKAQDEYSRSGKRRQTMQSAGRGRKLSVERRATASAVATGTVCGDPLAVRAHMMATELVGAYSDPFSIEETLSRERYVYSVGNTVLCALNLAYNELGYASVVRLLAVLKYQAGLARRAGAGLLHVLLEGNALPVTCPELNAIQETLDHALVGKLVKPQKTKPDRSAGKAKSK